jgi:hypothetical protein
MDHRCWLWTPKGATPGGGKLKRIRDPDVIDRRRGNARPWLGHSARQRGREKNEGVVTQDSCDSTNEARFFLSLSRE